MGPRLGDSSLTEWNPDGEPSAGAALLGAAADASLGASTPEDIYPAACTGSKAVTMNDKFEPKYKKSVLNTPSPTTGR